jgi:hypothetical protein
MYLSEKNPPAKTPKDPPRTLAQRIQTPVHYNTLAYFHKVNSLQILQCTCVLVANNSNFCFINEYSNVSEPDPHGSALILIGWIRIQDKMTHKNIKSLEISCFEVLSFEG